MNQGYQYLVDGCVIQSVTTFEVNHIVIMPEERLFTIHLSVIVTKHTPYSLLVSKRSLKNGNASAGSTGMSGTITSKSGNLFLNVRMVPLAADEPKPWK